MPKRNANNTDYNTRNKKPCTNNDYDTESEDEQEISDEQRGLRYKLIIAAHTCMSYETKVNNAYDAVLIWRAHVQQLELGNILYTGMPKEQRNAVDWQGDSPDEETSRACYIRANLYYVKVRDSYSYRLRQHMYLESLYIHKYNDMDWMFTGCWRVTPKCKDYKLFLKSYNRLLKEAPLPKPWAPRKQL
jgi:hypothetical protein